MGWLKHQDFGHEIIDLMVLRQDGEMEAAERLQTELEQDGCPEYLIEMALAERPLKEKEPK